MTNIDDLPKKISDYEEGHIDDHEIIHGALISHEARIIGVEEGKSDAGHGHVIGDVENLRQELNAAKRRDASEFTGNLTEDVDSSLSTIRYPVSEGTHTTTSLMNFVKDSVDGISELEDGLNNAVSVSATIRSHLDNTTSDTVNIRNDLDDLTDNVSDIRSDLDNAVSTSSTIRTDLNKVTQDASELRVDVDAVTDSAAELRTDLTGAQNVSSKIRADLTAAENVSTGIRTDLNELSSKSDAIRGDLQNLTVETANIANDVEDVTEEAASIRSSMNYKANLVAGKIPTSEIPAIALTKPTSVVNRAQMLALTAQEGDVAIITGENADKGTYMLGDGPSNVFASWILLATSPDVPVQSVNGQIGTIVLGHEDVGAAPESHSHSWSEVTGKPGTFNPSSHTHSWSEVTGKPSSYTPSSHTHPIANITGLQSALDGKVENTDSRLTNARTPTAHTHTIANVTGLQNAIDGKVNNTDPRLTDARDPKAHTHAWSGITDKPSSFTPSSHTHTISEVADLESELGDKAERDWTISRGTNLVTNGTGYLGDNTNFSDATFDSTDTPEGVRGSFVPVPRNGSLWSDELIPINSSNRYSASYFARQRIQGRSESRHYLAVQPVDSYGNLITPMHYAHVKGTLTTLSKDLEPGDTTVHLESANGWQNHETASRRRFIFWDYIDPGGKLWEPETYSRNQSVSSTWENGGVDTDTNIITLTEPWNGPRKPEGTQLSNGISGSTYMYLVSNVEVPEQWKQFSGQISAGINTTGAASTSTSGWPPGTGMARVGFLINREVPSEHAFAGIEFAPVPDPSSFANNSIPESKLDSSVQSKLNRSDVTWSTISGKPSTFAPSDHTHAISDLNTTGTRSSSTYLRGDGSWAPVPGGTDATILVGDLSNRVNVHNAMVDIDGSTVSVGSAMNEFVSEIDDIETTLDEHATDIAGKANSSHTHAWGSITGKPNTFTPSTHTHIIADTTGLQSALNAKVANTDPRLSDARTPTTHSHTWASITAKPDTFAPDDHSHAWGEITGKPSTFTPSSHTHTTAQITGLDTALAGKAATSHTHTIAQISNLQSSLDGKVDSTDSRLTNARTPTAHTHTIANVTNLQTTLNNKADLVNNQIPTSQIPAVALTKPFPVTSRAQMLALTAQEGDMAIITTGPDKGTYMLGDGPSSTYSSWVPLASSVDVPVQSVNGQTGTIVLSASNVGAAPASHTHTIGNISGLQSALDEKSGSTHTHTWASITGKPSTFTPATHTHTIANVTGLQTAIDGKANSSHSHTIANITGLQSALDGKSATSHTHTWSSITSKPSTFTPSEHTHTIANITNLQSTLNGKASSSHTHTADDISGAFSGDVDVSRAVVSFTAQGHTQELPLGEMIGDIREWTAVVDYNIDDLRNSKANTSHTHTIGNVSGLQTALNEKAALSHSHTWNSITNKPTAFTPSTHTHTIAQVNGLQAAIDAKIQLVTNFPASPTPGVLYLKAE